MLLPTAARAVRLINQSGALAVVVSNQSGLGRGLITPDQLSAVHQRMNDLLSKQGAHLDAIYFCPHKPDENCRCRKPKTGLVEQAAIDLNIDLSKSYMIGDCESDVMLGRNMGGKSALTLTGEGELTKATLSAQPDFVAKDVLEAVKWILGS